MKFVIYKGQQKFTIDNAWMPDEENFEQMIDDFKDKTFTMEDLQLYEVRITATRGMSFERDEIDDMEMQREIREGINWKREAVN